MHFGSSLHSAIQWMLAEGLLLPGTAYGTGCSRVLSQAWGHREETPGNVGAVERCMLGYKRAKQ